MWPSAGTARPRLKTCSAFQASASTRSDSYRALDRLLPHKQAIEAHLVKRLGELFELDYDLLLYDVTSTYFEGVADPAIAKRGYSRDHRPDCVQVNIALVVTREGMPLGYEIFPGNRNDVTTVEEIVSGMEARFGKANRVWVMDRGMVSAENLAWLNQTRRRYVIGTPKAELRRWARQLEEKTDWRHIREDVEVKVCRGPEGQETFLLCRSASRVDKERAMHERFGKHIEEGLDRPGRRIERSKKPMDRGAIERQIGRLLGRNSRAAGGFSIAIIEDDTHPAGVKLTWKHRPGWQDWARLSEGVYILRTNIAQWSDEELRKTYIQLSEAEAAFRIQKSDLAIRPIWHHKQDRIKAHIPGVLHRLCAVEDALAVAITCGTRTRAANHPGGVLAHPRRRHRAAAGGYEETGATHPLRGAPGSRAGDPA